MVTFRDLGDISIGTLYKTYDEAFCDYPVNLGFDEAKLQNCFDRRGCEGIHSYGAFEGDKLIGFTYNAVRELDGKLTAYDALTGVSIHHRRKGAGKGIMLASSDHFKEMGIESYILEVIDTNEGAYALYKSCGFEFSRKLDWYSLSEKHNLDSTHDVRIMDEIDDEMWDKFVSFWDYTPSWQNNVDSVKACRNDFLIAVAFENGEPVGYAACDKNSCGIAQIAVAKDKRRRGIGSSILAFIGKNTPSKGMSIGNVDDRNTSLAAFLKHYGFKMTLVLHELEKKL